MSDDKSAKVPYFDTTVSVDADVEISPRELHEAGWHHENECGVKAEPRITVPTLVGGMSDREAIASLHRQAHPGEPDSAALCSQEPCRSLSFDQVAARLGRAS
jgi:hypothetical protein